MAENKAMLMFFNKRYVFECLSGEQCKRLIIALYDLAENEVETDFEDDGVLKMAYLTMKIDVENNKERWEEECRKRSEAGKKGMASRWGKKDDEKITDDNTDNNVISVITNDNNVISVITDDNKHNKEKEKEKEKIKEKIKEKENGIIEANASMSTGVDLPDDVPAQITPSMIVELYNTICTSFPKVTVLSEKRKKAIVARLKSMNYTLEAFRTLFEKAEMSEFLKGRNNRNWRATFDWLIADGNMAKVLDGNYDNRPSTRGQTENGETIPSWAQGMAEWAAKRDAEPNNNDPLGFISG